MRNKFGLVILGVMLLGASGCSSVPDAVNPISWYRDATGLSKNDDLGKGQNEQNLAEGSNEPFPNLGNVPSAPDNQLSGVDRDKLVKSLVADRNNAQYSADNLRAGDVTSTVPPPAPPAPKSDKSSATISSAQVSDTPTSSPAPSPPPAAPGPTVTSNTVPPPASPPPPVPPPSPAGTASAAPPPQAATPPTNKATASNAQQQGKPPVRGSEAPPAESSLQSPTIPNLPQGETPTPAPPPPARAAASAPPSNQVANAAPPPSTRAPVLRPPGSEPTQQAAAPGNAPATAAAHRPGVSYRVADVSFAPGSAYLSGALRGTIAEIVKIHNTEGGTIRIVGFGESKGTDAAIAGLTLALDRAQAVAVALTDSGVAARDISVEAAPVAAKGGSDAPRAEIYLEH